MLHDPAPCCFPPCPRLSGAGTQGLQVPLHQHVDLEGVGPITRRGNLEGEATHAVPGPSQGGVSMGFGGFGAWDVEKHGGYIWE